MDMKSGNKNTAEMAERTLFDTIGDELRRARTSKNLSIEKAAEALNIRPIYIEALENNKTDAFPAPVYGVAFLRSYADYLGLESDVLVRQYKEKNVLLSNMSTDFPIHSETKVIPDKRVLIGVGVVLLLLVIGIAGIVHFNKTVSENESAITTEMQIMETLPIETEMPVEKILSGMEEETLNQAIETQVTTVQSIVEDYPGLTGERFGKTENARVVLVAKEEVWISVSNQNNIIFNRVLNKGDAYFVPTDEKELRLKTGNAPALSVYVDKMPKGTLSKTKKVMNNVKLEADTFQK